MIANFSTLQDLDTWTNMPAGSAIYNAQSGNKLLLDLGSYSQFIFYTRVVRSGAVGAFLYIEGRNTSVNYGTSMGGSIGINVGASMQVGALTNIPVGLNARSELKIMGSASDGVADPQF